jgi:hypothetical protein
MSDEAALIPYKVIYSGRVKRAATFGRSRDVLDALRDIDHRLRIYPQFGEPLRDLSVKPLQLWIGTIGPLVVQYILDEDQRQVFVVRPFKTLRGLSF